MSKRPIAKRAQRRHVLSPGRIGPGIGTMRGWYRQPVRRNSRVHEVRVPGPMDSRVRYGAAGVVVEVVGGEVTAVVEVTGAAVVDVVGFLVVEVVVLGSGRRSVGASSPKGTGALG